MTISSTFRQQRSKSMPTKATFKIPQKCYFYHAKKYCKWGNFCKYQHQLYVPKPITPIGSSQPPPPTLPPQLTYDHKERLHEIREKLRAE